MYNISMEFKIYLLLFPPHEQIYEIDIFMNFIRSSNRKKISTKFKMLKELRLIKKQIIMLLQSINSHTNYLFTLTIICLH